MNKLILIGNGFDLAHGLKTGYSDFLLWYLNQAIGLLEINNIYEDELISLNSNRQKIFFQLNSIDKLYSNLEQNGFILKCKTDFLKNIFNQAIQYKWVDIENHYYLSLIEIYKSLEKNNSEGNGLADLQLDVLNKNFEVLKTKLNEYLLTVGLSQRNDEIANKLLFELNADKRSNNNLFLNFNYTSTIELYKDLFPFDNQFQINYIHGKLNDKNNPIIFGYGDEMDTYYEKIERLNNNNFLKNIKSFYYLKARNYHNFLSYIDSAPFYVYIMGHSCGVSDRILLKSIFEHEYCQNIKIFYYQKSKIENDFTEKTQEISRHFTDKKKMRGKIINFQDCVPLTTYKADRIESPRLN